MSPIRATVCTKAEQAELSFATNDRPHALMMAAQAIVADLAKGRAIDAAVMRATMESAFGASDEQGAWSWKDAYEACEAGQVLFLRRYGPAIKMHAQGEPSRFLAMLTKIGALLPTQSNHPVKLSITHNLDRQRADCARGGVTAEDRKDGALCGARPQRRHLPERPTPGSPSVQVSVQKITNLALTSCRRFSIGPPPGRRCCVTIRSYCLPRCH
jgi:hypothetical protein